MRTLLSWSLALAIVATSQMAHADCLSEARDCRSDAVDKRDDCLGVCDADDSDCKHECRSDYSRDRQECEQTRAECLADERATDNPSSPGIENRQPTASAPPAVFYQQISPPVYAPNGVMVQRPVYQAYQLQPNTGAPVMVSPNATAGQCPSGAYIYHGIVPGAPTGSKPRQYYPVPPNALCK